MHLPSRKLCATLGYEFARGDLLKTALTHRSAGGNNNERLEFLGDAILSFVIADALYRRFATAHEGDLSRLRASLVRGETLAEIARGIGLGDALVLGPGELKSGGFHRDSILAGALEAIIGAVFADGGIEPCRALIETLYEERLDALSLGEVVKDPKTRLQEFLQARREALPEYRIISVEGLDHAQVFRIECVAAGLPGPVTGEGSSRRRAEQDAAEKALSLLGA